MEKCRSSHLKIFRLQDSTRELAQKYSCSSLVAAILQMNHSDATEDRTRIRSWLNPKFEKIIEGLSLGSAGRIAADKWKSLESFGKVFVYGDYDVDGISSTVLAMEIFEGKAEDVQYFIPRRDVQGYGLHKLVVRRLVEMGCNTLVVVDCGTKDKEMLDELEKEGINIFVFDHHSVGESEAYWEKAVNPNIDGDEETRKLCAAAVLWFWAWNENILPKHWLLNRIDLVAIATISDCMPLNLLNRSLVQHGMNQMRSQPRQGLACLFDKLGLSRFTISEEQLSMKVIPCLNAPGRVDCADLSVKVMRDEYNISKYVDELINLNKKRQLISDSISGSVTKIISSEGGFSYVLYDDDWSVGVLSSVASRICNVRRKPIALAAPIKQQIRGTLRVPEGIDAIEILKSISHNLLGWGGHQYAAGFSVSPEKWGEVQKQLEEILSGMKVMEKSIQALEIRPSEITINDWRLVDRLGPFGKSNPHPYFYLPATGNERSLPLGKGKQHVQVEVDGVRLLAFNGHEVLDDYNGVNKKNLGWVYHPRIDYWQGEERIQFILDYIVAED
ncbi:MAG: DHHA1 domain-containing protein [Synergistaceae bacterium]|nr:DHHA1 domain-containing protein [Synergistaceae bacterium]